MIAPLTAPLLLASELATDVTGDTTDATTVARWRDAIVKASEWLERVCGRSFSEQVDTRYFTALSIRAGGDLNGMELYLNDDPRRVTTLLNGDGTTILSTSYQLLPRNPVYSGVTAKPTIRLNPSGGVYWTVGGSTDPVGAISVTGLWGYGGQWVDTGATLGAAITSDSATTFTASSGPLLEIGMVLKIDSEYLYVSGISTNTITVTRGYNGSTAATHLIGTAIYRWQALDVVQTLIKRLVVWKIEQAKAPLVGQAVIGDLVFPLSTDGIPKDVLFTIQAANLKRVQMPLGV